MQQLSVIVSILLLLVVSTYCGPLPFSSKLLNLTTNMTKQSIDKIENITAPIANLANQLYEEAARQTGLRVAQWRKESGVNPEELGSYFEGDIIIPHNKTRLRNGLRDISTRWRGGEVPYVISPQFNPQQRRLILEAMNDYHTYTCIKFVPYNRRNGYHKDYIDIGAQPTGCWSYVGRVGNGRQEVNIQVPGCDGKGTIIHELMHAIGFHHEQNRSDRDYYVQVYLQNVEPKQRHNFDKLSHRQISDFGVSYDYRSVMHYSEYAFSSNNRPTMVSRTPGQKLGQREGFSNSDIQKIRRMYNCDRRRTG